MTANAQVTSTWQLLLQTVISKYVQPLHIARTLDGQLSFSPMLQLNVLVCSLIFFHFALKIVHNTRPESSQQYTGGKKGSNDADNRVNTKVATG